MGRAFPLSFQAFDSRALSMSLIPSLRSARSHDQGGSPLWKDALLARHEISPTLQGDLKHDHLQVIITAVKR